MSNARRRGAGHKSPTFTSMPGPTAQTAPMRRRRGEPLRIAIAGLLIVFGLYYYLATGSPRSPHVRRTDLGKEVPSHINKIIADDQRAEWIGNDVLGHGDFADGRKKTTHPAFVEPASEALHWVNVMLGNDGPEPDLSGGMIPAVAPPFAMTRWTPQTRQNWVSMCPYNQTDTSFHGFLGTHQPAIWMGESGPSQISAGLGDVETSFESRGLPFERADEYASANYYRTVLNAGENGRIEAEMTATSRVGHLRFSFSTSDSLVAPNVVVQASRESVLMSQLNTGPRKADNVTYPRGSITIDAGRQEVYGWNDERQDSILVGDDLPAKSFKGYFVARFSAPFADTGISYSGKLHPGVTTGEGEVLAGYVTFAPGTAQVEVRVGVSFISIEQARRNLNSEIPDRQTLEQTSRQTRTAWAEKLDILEVSGATPQNKTVLYSSFAHTLVYPYEIFEETHSGPAYYSGYLDQVVPGKSYSGYSIWDTFRAETAWLILTAPERVPEMINSMLQDYDQGGWLPMWKNLVETNIMVGTHGDAIIAQAISAGVKGVDWKRAWEAVRKNAYTPPDRDTELRFEDREEHTPQEVRAGLTEYMSLGYVAADLHSESGSRTFDYAYDDHSAAIVAQDVGATTEAAELSGRAKSYANLWNGQTGFMEARNSNGDWAGEKVGWTEGDHWAYTLDVMHDVPGLIELMGGNSSFVAFMDRHFNEGHNKHTNEPSHHVPYMYNYAGAPHKTQEKVLEIGQNEYNHTAGGLSGNEDCGQMSAWYLFSALGFYSVDPASATYVIGTPFFDSISLRLPGAAKPLSVTAKGASDGRNYIKSVTIDGKPQEGFVISHDQIKDGAEIVFEMEMTPQVWGM